MIYLLDTDTAVMIIRGLNIKMPRNEKQVERMQRGHRIFDICERKSLAGHTIGLSAIVAAELDYGACEADHPDLERAKIEQTLAPLLRFDFDAADSALRYGKIRHALESTGQSIGPNDLFIAAHALALGAVLITNNTREFKRVKGLKCENWSLA